MRTTVTYTTALLLGLLVGASCERDDGGKLHRSIVNTARTNRIDLNSLILGEWSRVFIFGPYTSAATIRECVGKSAAARNRRHIGTRDDINLLIIEKRSGSFRTIAVPRAGADFVPKSVGLGFKSGNAQFVASRDSVSGWIQLVPVSEPDVKCSPSR
jgi:hypothetical protein